MRRTSWLRRAPVLLASLFLLAGSRAWAAGPSDLWTVPNAFGATFSADGTSALLTIPDGFQLRRVTDGALERTLLLPAASIQYNAFALSPDKKLVALTYRASAVTKIELWSLSTGALVRSIATAAKRNARGIDVSSKGLVAIFERFAYGGGGFVYIYRTDTGALVTQQGPYTNNSTTDLQFSADGQYLAIQVRNPDDLSVRVLRTADWGTAFVSPPKRALFRWAPGRNALWTSTYSSGEPWQLLDVPSGAVLATFAEPTGFSPTDVTFDARLFFAGTLEDDKIAFLRVPSGAAALTYAIAGSSSGQVSPNGDAFSYTVCPTGGACELHVARMPRL